MGAKTTMDKRGRYVRLKKVPGVQSTASTFVIPVERRSLQQYSLITPPRRRPSMH